MKDLLDVDSHDVDLIVHPSLELERLDSEGYAYVK